MSALRQPAQDKLRRDYYKLAEICRKDCQARHRAHNTQLHQLNTTQEESCAEDIIGTEDEFRTKMEDNRYKQLAELLLRIAPSKARRKLNFN